MKLRKRCAALLLAVLLLASALPFFASMPASASVESNINSLTVWQQDFLRVIRSLALKDAYDTGVLPSITAGQALYEGGWARYGISVIANNQYGIKAYSNWDGKVFDNNTYMLYDSYDDLVRIKGSSYARYGSIWRAYDSWEESVADHSALFYAEAKYEDVLAASTYQEAAEAIVRAGYTSNYDYIANLIKIIEDYGLDQLDTVEPDVNGVFGMIMDQARAVVSIGTTFRLQATAYPEPVLYVPDGSVGGEAAVPFSITWESNAPSVATVDQQGNVKAIAQGIALITATYNGKEAACLVCVGTNAFVIDSDVSIRSAPDSEADSLGKIYRGMPVALLENRVYTASDGTAYYRVRGTVSTGKLQIGYVVAEQVYFTSRGVSVLSSKTELNLDVGITYCIEVEVAPADAENKTLTWRSSDTSVVGVDSAGVITTHSVGTAVVTVTAASGISLDITVHVGGSVTYYGVTTSNLYVRAAPDLSAEKLGLIAEGTEILLLGEPENGWYHVEAELIDGTTVQGYSSATYIELVTDHPEPVDPTPSEQERTGIVAVDDGSSLNIRSTPGTSGKKLISVDNGTMVVIVGEDILLESEKTYQVWYHIHLNLDGMFYDGYAAAAFVKVTDTGSEEPSDPSSPYTVGDGIITGVSPGTTYAEFRMKLNANVRVYRPDGVMLESDDIVSTGDEARYIIGSTLVRTRWIAVRGDVNGDGKVTAVDYMMLKRCVLGTYELEGIYYQAALLTGGDVVSAKDYMMLKRAVLGTYEL